MSQEQEIFIRELEQERAKSNPDFLHEQAIYLRLSSEDYTNEPIYRHLAEQALGEHFSADIIAICEAHVQDSKKSRPELTFPVNTKLINSRRLDISDDGRRAFMVKRGETTYQLSYEDPDTNPNPIIELATSVQSKGSWVYLINEGDPIPLEIAGLATNIASQSYTPKEDEFRIQMVEDRARYELIAQSIRVIFNRINVMGPQIDLGIQYRGSKDSITIPLALKTEIPQKRYILRELTATIGTTEYTLSEEKWWGGNLFKLIQTINNAHTQVRYARVGANNFCEEDLELLEIAVININSVIDVFEKNNKQ